MTKAQLLTVVSWVRQFVRDKLHSRNENLPYYLTIFIAAVVFIVALNGFVELTGELAEKDLQSFDEVVTTYVISFRSEGLTDYFRFATDLGDRNAYIVFIVLLTIFYVAKHRSWKFVVQTTLVLILATLSNMALKQVINRARPAIEHLVTVNTLSYPSGHSMSAMAFYGFLIFLCLRYKMPRWLRFACVFLLSLLIASVGISRIYLGVHYPSDVLGGFIGGLIWVAFCAVVFSLIDLLRRRGKRSGAHEKTA